MRPGPIPGPRTRAPQSPLAPCIMGTMFRRRAGVRRVVEQEIDGIRRRGAESEIDPAIGARMRSIVDCGRGGRFDLESGAGTSADEGGPKRTGKVGQSPSIHTALLPNAG